MDHLGEPKEGPRPLVGISAETDVVERYWGTVRHQIVTDDYVRAVRTAGGVPVVLPVGHPDEVATVVSRLDALVLTGGSDIHPSFYGEERLDVGTGGELDPERDRFDLALVDAVVATGLPTLAVCRGLQILNVAHGGSLIQHLDTHGATPEGTDVSHELTVDPSTRFAEWFPTLRDANSFHHQAIGRLGDGVRVAARSEDGTIEAIELDHAPAVVAVQWHPEVLLELPHHLGLFDWLIASASTRLTA